jgi:hypothetical protein
MRKGNGYILLLIIKATVIFCCLHLIGKTTLICVLPKQHKRGLKVSATIAKLGCKNRGLNWPSKLWLCLIF